MVTNIVSSLGAGSGIDTRAVIDELIAAERTARSEPISRRVQTLDARISALAQVRSSLQGIASSLDTRLRSGALGLQPASSDTARVGIARRGDGPTTGFRSTLTVNRLAAAQRLTSAPVAASGPIGQGVLTIGFGTRTDTSGGGFSLANSGGSIDITIGPENDSLSGLAAAINASGRGLTATIVGNGATASLAIRGEEGAANAFVISAAPVAGSPGLERFQYTPGSPTLALAGAASDADLVLDGVSVSRAGNSVDDLIAGTRLTLQQTGTVTLAAARDPAELESTLTDLASTLGAMRGLIADLRRPASADAAAGALLGDATSRQVDQRLAALMAAPVPQANGLRLADLGLSVARDGQVTFDAGRLAGLSPQRLADAEGLLKSLAAPALASQPDRLRSIAELVTPASAGLASQRGRLNRDLATVDTRLTAYRTQLTRQFAAMEASVALSRQVGQQLDQQIEAWVASLQR